MRILLLALPLLAATAAFGQNQAPTTKQFPIPPAASVFTPTSVDGCPVGISAQQRGGGQTMWTISQEDSVRAQGGAYQDLARGTGVHVELGAVAKPSMQQVELAVFYLSPGGRVIPAGEPDAGRHRSKTFTLSAQDGGSSKLAGDLLVGAAAGILRVHVVSIHYTDGTEWHAGRDSICSVEPDRFLPVAAR